MLTDAAFLEVLRDLYGATLTTMSDHIFVLQTTSRLPVELEQLCYKLNIDIPYQVLSIMGNNTPIEYTGIHQLYTYEFVVSSYDLFYKILSKEIEKKQFTNFSKVFDSEVQLELDQNKD